MVGKNLTYISLFSSAGVGCYGFKKAGFECIATNELIERRLNIQKINDKCKYDSGYIFGDIKETQTQNKIFKEIYKWKNIGNDQVDVIIATPPCQGMSVANHKKSDNEIERNSLVVESIKLIKKIQPRIFIFENVPAFMKTGCTALDGTIKEIGKVINEELAKNYSIYNRTLNFKNYGANSSRTRTLVIGIEKKIADYISPFELFPDYRKEKTLRQVIGNMQELEWGNFDEHDFYHQFRTYPEYMRRWIHNLKPGESAFENKNINEIPHKVIDGEIVVNKNKNGDKYTRQQWDKVAPCIHTRNDQIASQNTIHPTQDRVFSIRELMKLMTIPDDFKWINKSLEELNKLKDEEKRKLLKKEEINIRQSIGEAVPTNIFFEIAQNIKNNLLKENYDYTKIKKIIDKNKLNSIKELKKFIINNIEDIGYGTLCKIAEMANSKRETNDAYFTNKIIITEMTKELPDFTKNTIRILEPSVGVGNFIPFIIKKYDYIEKIIIDVVDIDKDILEIAKVLLERNVLKENVEINFIKDDFLLHEFKEHYDLVIGNPPFTKLKSTDNKLKIYLENNINKETNNLVAFFMEKALNISDYVALITPKNILNTTEYKETRDIMNKYNISAIIDNGEIGFKGVLIETICLVINTTAKPSKTNVKSIPLLQEIMQKQKYITDSKYPYWIIYRNSTFDEIANKMKFNIFDVFRDRQITNKNTIKIHTSNNEIRVLKSRNISDDGKKIINIENYDSYISAKELDSLSVKKYVNAQNVYLTPNMTYLPRVIKKPEGIVTNGSIAILIPKDENLELTEKEMNYYSTEEYRNFYKIARNYQTRSLNVDSNSVFFFGKKIEK